MIEISGTFSLISEYLSQSQRRKNTYNYLIYTSMKKMLTSKLDFVNNQATEIYFLITE